MWQPSIPAGCPVFDGFIVTNAEWKWQKYVADRWCTCKETKWQYKKPVLNQDCKDIFQKYYTQGSFPFLLYKKSWECLLPLQCILVESFEMGRNCLLFSYKLVSRLHLLSERLSIRLHSCHLFHSPLFILGIYSYKLYLEVFLFFFSFNLNMIWYIANLIYHTRTQFILQHTYSI